MTRASVGNRGGRGGDALQQWHTETLRRYMRGLDNQEITDKLDMFDRRSPHFIGNTVNRFVLTPEERKNAQMERLKIINLKPGEVEGSEQEQEDPPRAVEAHLSRAAKEDPTGESLAGALEVGSPEEDPAQADEVERRSP